jgi:hypothetical protein
MSKRNIFYALGFLALTAAAADFAKHNYLADSKGISLPKAHNTTAEARRLQGNLAAEGS